MHVREITRPLYFFGLYASITFMLSCAQVAQQMKAPIDSVKKTVNARTSTTSDQTNGVPKTAATLQPSTYQPTAASTVQRGALGVDQIFARGSVNGSELLTELQALLVASRNSSADALLASMMGDASRAASAQSSKADILRQLGLGILREQAFSYSAELLGVHLNAVTSDPQALSREVIMLPHEKYAALNTTQKTGVLKMAALVVAARVSSKMLQGAKSDFQNLEAEYGQLLARREQVAQLLADVMDTRRKALAAKDEAAARQSEGELLKWISKDDLDFLDALDPEQSLRAFSNDFAVQNVALRVLRARDPAAYNDFKVQSDGLVGRQRAYLRTVGGVAAFGGVLALSVQEFAGMSEQKNFAQAILTLPLSYELLTSSLPLVKLSAETLYTGLWLEPIKGRPQFRVVRPDKAIDAKHARDVFKALEDNNTQALLSQALFRNETPGLLLRVYLCNPQEAGRMLDSLIPAARREEFARTYLQLPKEQRFTFESAFSGGEATAPISRRVARSLLARDQRQQAESALLGDLQNTAAQNLPEDWKDPQLIRLVLANHERGQTSSQLQLGGSIVRLVPSMAAIYEYEAYSDGCRSMAALEDPPPKAPAPSAKPAKPAKDAGKKTKSTL